MKTFDSQELERLIKGHCKGELDSVRIHDFVRQTITNTLNYILESGLLEEFTEANHGGLPITYEEQGHNTLARNIKEFISNMDKK